MLPRAEEAYKMLCVLLALLCSRVCKSVCSSVWPTLRILERTGAGDTEVIGVVGSGFQAAGVAPARKPVARWCWLLLCTASLN